MIHARTQIRDRVVTLLTNLPSTGVNVFATRRIPLKDEQLPALCIYTLQDSRGEDNSIGARAVERDLQLVIQAVAKDSDDLDDVLDRIAGEIETMIGNGPDLGIGCKGSMLVSTVIVPKHEGADDIGSAVLTYLISYRGRPGDPYTIIS